MMRHQIRQTGLGFGLRPVELSDAEQIVAFRTDRRNQRYMKETSPKIADQIDWLQRYFERTGEWYFVIDRLSTGATEGLIGISDHDPTTNTAEWGRWILRRGSVAAVESALLIYRTAFRVLNLDAVYCQTVVNNRQVVSFHDSTGAERTRILTASNIIRGVAYDQVEHRVDRSRFEAIEPRLSKLAALAAATLTR